MIDPMQIVLIRLSAIEARIAALEVRPMPGVLPEAEVSDLEAALAKLGNSIREADRKRMGG